ncbi:hypothetical protein OPT61_g9862 [Boeremia exigua]|uniref:Uncharacterized protein n=1 Tax=Boeremia exigua TaxID=749465 RepID=A0ACC2HS87_9PLEO|nr:hypothetical protein OPT61_g9862 [Boeremia exigua]
MSRHSSDSPTTPRRALANKPDQNTTRREPNSPHAEAPQDLTSYAAPHKLPRVTPPALNRSATAIRNSRQPIPHPLHLHSMSGLPTTRPPSTPPSTKRISNSNTYNSAEKLRSWTIP